MRATVLWPRIARLALLAAIIVGTFAGPALAADIVLQDVGTDDYPAVEIGIALTADLIPAGGVPAFLVLENGIEAQSLTFRVATQDRKPIDVVLLVDVSGSMRGAPLDNARIAAKRFVAEMRPTDRVALIEFSSEPRTLLGFGSDVAALEQAIDSLQASGETALHDGLIQAARAFVSEDRDRAIVVLSDGGDTTSINTLDLAANTVAAAGAPVYAVALESPEYDPVALEQLSTRSGGRFVSAENAGVLSSIFEEIARELRNLYTLTYTSARPSTKELEIEVRATNGDVSAALTTAVDNPLYLEAPQPTPAPIEESSGRVDVLMLSSIGLIVFSAVALGVFGVGSLIAPAPDSLKQLRYYEKYQDSVVDESARDAAMRGSRGKVMEAVAMFAEAQGFTGMMHTRLERAGLPLRSNEYIFFHVLATTTAGIIAQFVVRSYLFTGMVVAVAVGLPFVVLGMRIDRRRARFEDQLPDILSLIAGSLRAGWGIQQALELAVDEISEPSASEFRRVQSEARFGLPLEQALSRMAERLDSDDFRWTVTAIAIQREVGGNLAEVLDVVAATIRTRSELRRHVSALTAESRFSAIVLAVLPFFIFGALAVVSPAYLGIMMRSGLGLAVLVFGMVLLIIGTVWIMRLTKVEV